MIVVVDLPNNQETRTRFINIDVILLYIIVACEECKEMRSPHLPTWGGNEDFFFEFTFRRALGCVHGTGKFSIGIDMERQRSPILER